MKQLILILCLATFYSVNLFGQNKEILNGFKYAVVSPVKYKDGSRDTYGIEQSTISSLQSLGLQCLNPENNSNWPQEALNEPCIVAYISMNNGQLPNSWNCGSIRIQIRNCKNSVIYDATQKSKNAVCYAPYTCCYYKWAKASEEHFSSLRYKYNPDLNNLRTEFPNVENTNETEESLTAYFDSNTLDEIEGIYKSYQSEQLGYYKIGIKKFGSKYKAIIIESDLNHWKQGEVKAVFETSSMKGFYSTKWNMGNKIPFETFALMENPALLTVEFKDAKTGEKRTDQFIKMYPSADVNASTAIDGIKATGSGFVISTDGVIATNAHVIEGADRIEIHLNNEFGIKTYSASVQIKDESNDVALLKIDDDEFKGFNSLPYSILQTTEIGEDVFTIGFPLSSLMGDNYKVTNGIISSNSGLKDDVRFIQITAPIQPGNSGGPLFNRDGNVVGLTTSKLNERAIGTSIENVNYAIKATYLINIYNMLPNKEQLSKSSTLSDKELKDQVKVLKNYICLIKIY
jgi:S1-C subfamily serine protease